MSELVKRARDWLDLCESAGAGNGRGAEIIRDLLAVVERLPEMLKDAYDEGWDDLIYAGSGPMLLEKELAWKASETRQAADAARGEA